LIVLAAKSAGAAMAVRKSSRRFIMTSFSGA